MADGCKDIKKLAAFLMLLFPILWSCSWTYRLNPSIGERHTIRAADKVAIYREPSSKGEPFYLEKPEEFVITEYLCSEGRFSCNIDAFLIKGVDAFFFKVRFKSGESGYIKYIDIIVDKADFIESEYEAMLAPRYYKNVDFDSVWNAAIDTIDSMGYVIAIMKKEEGYIATQMQVSSHSRNRVSIRLYREKNAVKVDVSTYGEEKRGDKENPYWVETGTSGYSEQWILNKIEKRLSGR